MIAIVDYGVGNLFSLKSSFHAIGAEVVVTSEPQVIGAADRIILPGVGAFPLAMENLNSLNMVPFIRAQAEKKPLLGICLGMQMLFEKSYEYGEHEGLGLIPGAVRPLRDVVDPTLKIPHIGWNPLQMTAPKDPLFQYVENGDCVYFVHSYYAADCDPYVIATSEYSCNVTAAVRKENIWGAQFHPEKSGKVGLAILRAFCEM